MEAVVEAVFNRAVLSVGWFALGASAALFSGGLIALLSGGGGGRVPPGAPAVQRHWLTVALIGVPVVGGVATAVVQTFAAARYAFVGAAAFGMVYAFFVRRKSD